MSNKPYDLAVVIGRFQPLHNGHAELLRKASEQSDNVLVLVGSSFCAQNTKNPFSFDMRRKMIRETFEYTSNLTTAPLIDNLYSNEAWIAQVQGIVKDTIQDRGFKEAARVAIVGHERDNSSAYMKWFPRWDVVEVGVLEGDLNATMIRDKIYLLESLANESALDYVENRVPDSVYKIISEWMENNKDEYKRLCEENHFIKLYQEPYENLPFPPIFVTTDAVAVCKGHVLLIKRKMHPGKGLWALPGGFLDVHETIENCIVRELKEETRIKVHKNILHASLKGVHVFDAPSRSLRGRTITHAGLIVLEAEKLPEVRGGDDAAHARWIPLADFYGMTDQMYEDHASIISFMINRV